MPAPKLNSLKSVRAGASYTAEQLARLANVSLKSVLAEEDAVAKNLSGGSGYEPAEQARIAAVLSSTVATLRA